MFLTGFWKKLRTYLWSLGTFTFLWVVAPSREHLGCWVLCQSSLIELYYQLIGLNQDSKVIQGVKIEKKKTMENLTFFVNFRLNQIQNCSIQIKKMKDNENERKKYFEASRWAHEQASEFFPSDRYFSFFQLVISAMYVIFFVFGQMFIRFLSIIFFFLLKFDSTTFVHRRKTFRWNVSFSIS